MPKPVVWIIIALVGIFILIQLYFVFARPEAVFDFFHWRAKQKGLLYGTSEKTKSLKEFFNSTDRLF